MTARRGVLALGVFVVIVVVAFAPVTLAGGRIVRGVHVAGTDVGGMTPDEAIAALGVGLPSAAAARTVTLLDPTRAVSWTQSAADLGIVGDPAASAEAAYAVGRTGLLGRITASWRALLLGVDVPPVWAMRTEDSPAFRAILDNATLPPSDARIEVKDGQMVPVPALPGRAVDRAATVDDLLAALATASGAPVAVELRFGQTAARVGTTEGVADAYDTVIGSPVTLRVQGQPVADVPVEVLRSWFRVEDQTSAEGDVSPAIVVDRDAIALWLATNVVVHQTASLPRYTWDPTARALTVLRPSQPGLALDALASVDPTIAAAYTPQRTGELAVAVTEPPVTSAEVESLNGFVDVAHAYTRLDTSPTWRRHHVELAATALQGVVLAPGEELSFTEALGPVTAAGGYLMDFLRPQPDAPVGWTGGLEQVATTYYRAAMWAGLPVLERHPSPFRVGWLEPPVGFDAAVEQPGADLRIANDSSSYLILQNELDALRGAFAVTIYADPEVAVGVAMDPPVVTDVTPAGEPLERASSDVPRGARAQAGWAREGATARVSMRVVSGDGTQRTEVVETTYPPASDVILVGR